MAPRATEYEAEVDLTYNSDQRGEVHAMGNIPLGNSPHAMRLTGYTVVGDHLYENSYTGEDLNDANKWGVKSRTLFDLTGDATGPDLGEFLVTLDYTKENTDCCALAVIQYEGLSTLNTPSLNTPSARSTRWSQARTRCPAGPG